MRIAIHQPNYAPWCGYFAKMKVCDVFVFLDDAQLPGGSYVNRAQIRNEAGASWLTVPIRRRSAEPIAEVEPADPKWQAAHVRRLFNWYRKASHFRTTMALIEPVYATPFPKLADFNMTLVRAIAGYLNIEPRFEISSHLHPEGAADERNLSLVQLLGGDTYVSGKGGTNYQDPAIFEAAGIGLEIREYRPLPYPQFHGEFLPGMSILDAIFNLGPAAVNILEYPS